MTPPPAAAPALQPRRAAEPAPDRRNRRLTAPPRHPRRVSGPARRGERDRRSPAHAGAARGLIGLLHGVAPRALLDRLLIRLSSRQRGREAVFGRAWIAVVAFALIGIVTLQLGLLKLNASIGRALEHTALLQRENAALSVENSEMAASDRVQARAAGLGMELLQPGALRFLTTSPRTDATRGAAALSSTPAGSPTGSAEAQLGSGAGTQASASAPEGEASGAGTSPSAGQASPATTPATTPATGEHLGAPAGEAKPQSGESTAASPPSSPSTGAPAGGGQAEASPAGGTQSGSSG